MDKKEKTFFDKIKELDGKPGTIELSDKDRTEFVKGEEEYIYKEHDKRDNYIWFLMGIGIGVLGNFIVNLFYDWVKSLGGWKFGLMSFVLILLFLMIAYRLYDQLKEHNDNLNRSYKQRDMWSKAKSVNIGPPMKMYNSIEELEKDRQNSKKSKNQVNKGVKS